MQRPQRPIGPYTFPTGTTGYTSGEAPSGGAGAETPPAEPTALEKAGWAGATGFDKGGGGAVATPQEEEKKQPVEGGGNYEADKAAYKAWYLQAYAPTSFKAKQMGTAYFKQFTEGGANNQFYQYWLANVKPKPAPTPKPGEIGKAPEKGTETLSADAYELYQTLRTYAYSHADALTYSKNFDLGLIPIDRVAADLGRLREARTQQSVAAPLHFSLYPMGTIKQKLIEDAMSNQNVMDSIKRAQTSDAEIYGGRYGSTLEDWANQRAKEIHFGVKENKILGFPTTESRDFETRLQGLRESGQITDQEYADALFLRLYGNIPLAKGGSTEQQRINAAEYFLQYKKAPPLPQGEAIPPDYLSTMPSQEIIPPEAVPPGGFVQQTQPPARSPEWEDLVQRAKQKTVSI